MYIDRNKTVKDDTTGIARNLHAAFSGIIFNSLQSTVFSSYPLMMAISDAIFYIPSFIRMKVFMNPAMFNDTIVRSILGFADTYLHKSMVVKFETPKVRLLYKSFLTTSMPYTSINWG